MSMMGMDNPYLYWAPETAIFHLYIETFLVQWGLGICFLVASPLEILHF